ncbi:MAG: hexose kinase [Candidatus Lokiarchaeota archaeon]|nr:hexose kinase [Candidatus Lokiarchaeota archaeon]
MIHCVLLNPTVDRILRIAGFKLASTYKVNKIHEFPVGKAISVALTLKELQQDVNVIALIGQKEITSYERFLRRKKIAHTLIPIDGDTRSNITILDDKKKMTTHLRLPGFRVNQFHLKKIENILVNKVKENDFVVFSGSFPDGVPADYHFRVHELLKNKNIKFIVDTSGRPLELLLNVNPFIIKANLEEMSVILNKELTEAQELENRPTDEDLQQLLEMCSNLNNIAARFNVLTLGDYGALLFTDQERYYGFLDIEDATYTVGCGDSFLGGLIAGLNQNKSLPDILRLAVACGGANTQELGAGLLKKSDVDKYLELVELKKL